MPQLVGWRNSVVQPPGCCGASSSAWWMAARSCSEMPYCSGSRYSSCQSKAMTKPAAPMTKNIGRQP